MPRLPEGPRPTPYQPLPFVFGASLLGILGDYFLSVPYFVWIGVSVVSLLGWLVLLVRVKTKPVFSTLILLVAIGAVFGLRHHVQWNFFHENDLGFYATELGGPAGVRGTLIDLPRRLPKPPDDPSRPIPLAERTLFTFHAEFLRDGKTWIPVNGKVSVVVEGDRSEFRYGDRLELFGQLSKPLPPQNFGDWDLATSLRNRRILSILRVPSPDAAVRLDQGNWSLGKLLESIRRTGRTNLERCMNSRNAPIATAMILGLREGVDEETTQTLLETGTLHILAISGLHVGLVAATIGLLLAFFGVPRRTTAVVLAVVVVGYLMLTDVQPPAIRATVLVLVVAAAMFTNRRSQTVNTLCATALIVLALNPSELFQFGAQLSFLATGAFLWIPVLPQRLRFPSQTVDNPEEEPQAEIEYFESGRWLAFRSVEKFLFGVATLFLVSLTIWTVSTPLILERIHLLTPVALLVNPLLWFPLTAAMLSGFAVMIFGAVPGLGSLFGWFADLSFDALFGMIAFFQHLGGHYWTPGPPIWWNVVFYTGFVALTFFPIRKPPKKILAALFVGWILVGVGVGLFERWERRWNDRLTVSICSVGHGSAILIITPESRAVIYDAGCFSSPKRSGDVLSRALWRFGKTRIDAIVLSHADSDHYNGVATLAERFRIDEVFVSPYMFEKQVPGLDLLREILVDKKIPIRTVGDGDDLATDGLPGLKFLHPPKEGSEDRDQNNACSVVMVLEHRNTRFLFSGDLDSRLSPPFLERPPLHCENVMVPHHGGRSRLTEPLLAWTTPKHLAVSGGHFTRNEDLLDDFRRRGFTLYSTFDDGAIEWSLDRSGERWKRFRTTKETVDRERPP